MREATSTNHDCAHWQVPFEELLVNACERPASLSLRRAVSKLDPVVDAVKLNALDSAARRLMLHDERCALPALLDALQSLDNEAVSQRLRRAVVSGLAAEFALAGCSQTLRPRLIESLQLLLGRRWVQLRGAVQVVEDLLEDWPAERLYDEGVAQILPPCLALLSAIVEVAYGPELVRAVAAAPKTRKLLSHREEVKLQFPLLAAALAPLLSSAPKAGVATQEDSLCSSDDEQVRFTNRLPAPFSCRLAGPVIFEAVEDLGGPETEDLAIDSFSPYSLLPTFLPPNVDPGVCHSGLLLAGTGGIVEEWDLDAGFRVDRLCVSLEDDEQNCELQVTALASPDIWSRNGEPDAVVVAAVNGRQVGSGGMAVLHRDEETRAWQVEAPYLPEESSMTARRIAKISRIDYLHGSTNLLVAGQMSALGSHEIGLYDTAVAPARPLAAFIEHKDFVADVCALSSQAFVSVSLDASLLLWDLRFGFRPAGRGGFEQGPGAGICSIAADRGSLLLCGTLLGDCYLFDARALSRPLMRPPSVQGAVVRLRLWAEDSVGAVAALASSEEGLCSLRLGAGSGSGELRRAAYSGAPADSSSENESVAPSQGEAVMRPRLCFDMDRAAGSTSSILACGSWGVTRYRQLQHQGKT
mmetsp:Transcript_49528/g.78420  ORF Transcript_49528/g.78420 Transcript_49528/m.78420 type:complete len:640 (+) Transcript_49528:68-1987(+)